jgi:VWFA-related protein
LSTATQQAAVVERVEVGRVLIDVRVVDGTGRPVEDLGPTDFDVAIDGRPARVDRAHWLGRVPAAGVSAAAGPASAAVPGRLIVFVVQQTTNANVARHQRDLTALGRALRLTDQILADASPSDRIAVVSFDRHLKVWTDFTSDGDLVRRILQSQLLVGSPPDVIVSRDVSLMAGAFRRNAESTYTVEESLRLLGEALQPLAGSKTVVWLGYGFGRPDALKRSLVEAASLPGMLEAGYTDALKSLTSARATVLSVDATEAHRHALDVGLQSLAEDTGGVFARAYPFPDVAMKMVANALEGYYTLSVERPAASPGSHRVRVRVLRDSLRAYAPGSYFD